MADTDKPLHLYVRGVDRWIDTATYPLTDRAVTFHLSPGLLRAGSAENGCMPNSNTSLGCCQSFMWAPEGEAASLSFDSAPLDAPLIIAGPGDVTINLKSTRPEVELAATVFDVSPDGSTATITNGALLGSQRASDRAASWYSQDGQLIRPSHYFTKPMSTPVPIGTTVQLDIELLPAMIRIPAGHRKDLLLPNPLVPTPEELANLTGGMHSPLDSRRVGFPGDPGELLDNERRLRSPHRQAIGERSSFDLALETIQPTNQIQSDFGLPFAAGVGLRFAGVLELAACMRIAASVDPVLGFRDRG